MRKNTKWFSVPILLWVIAILFIISWSVMWVISHFKQENYKKMTMLQASNYSQEWLELIRWYVQTQSNKDRKGYWQNSILPLGWNYSIQFSNWDYVLTPANQQKIEENDPFVVDYIRKIIISDGEHVNSKRVTSLVEYNGTQVSYDAVIYNLYWE